MATIEAAKFRLAAGYYDEFWERGFVVVPHLIDATLVPALRRDYDRAIAGEFGELSFGNQSKAGQQVQKPVDPGRIPGWDTHPYRLNGCAASEQLMGVKLQFRYGHMIRKPAHYPAQVQWHQDGYYWQNEADGVNVTKACTCWLALSEAFPANGSVMYIPGSHKRGLVPHTDQSANFEFDNAQEAQGFDRAAAFAVTLHPGDAVLHHPLTLHASGGNETDIPREGLTSHYFLA